MPQQRKYYSVMPAQAGIQHWLRSSLVVVVCVLLSACTPAESAPDPHTLQGQTLPAVEIKAVSGTIRLPLADTTKPTLINLWATWCAPCIKEMPDLNTLADMGLYNVVAVSIDTDFEAAKATAKEYNWGALTLAHDPNGRATKGWMPTGVPITYLINPSGTLVLVEAGERVWSHPAMLQKLQHALDSTR